jgi:hypothetical protein
MQSNSDLQSFCDKSTKRQSGTNLFLCQSKKYVFLRIAPGLGMNHKLSAIAMPQTIRSPPPVGMECLFNMKNHRLQNNS